MRTPIRATAAGVLLVGALHSSALHPGAPPRAAPSAAEAPSLLAQASARWTWPVAAPHTVVRGFVAPATPYSAGHRGIDVAAAVGAPVRAPADGVVTFAGRIADRGVLSIDLGDGVVASMEPVEAIVPVGSTVSSGLVVARVATGGHATGAVHLGVRVHGEYVSPLLFLGGGQRAILLPLDSG